MDHIVVDVEIQNTIEETPGGWNATDKLGVAVACVWEYNGGRMRVYGPDDVASLRARLFQADRISGFNIFNFDFPLIWGLSKEVWLGEMPTNETRFLLRPKTDDMLRRVWQSLGLNPDKFVPGTHGGYALKDIAPATIGADKIGFGGDAPHWFKAGQIHRVANYCADDVAIERDLTDFADRYGYVLVERRGELQKVLIPKWTGGK